MPKPSHALSALSPLVLAALLPGQEDGPKPALAGLDPVLLSQGRETAGRADLVEKAGQYLYRFATDATLAAFRADSERFEIQFGGGCARMGPLSGIGDPDRFLVHDGRIYIFASDGCRDGFKQRTAQFFDPDTAAPEPTAEAAQRGADLLARTIAAHGGKGRLSAMATYKHRRDAKKGETSEQWRMAVQFPDHIRLDHDYKQSQQTWRYAKILGPKRAQFVDDGQERPMHASGRREVQRTLLREPLLMLRAALRHGAITAGRGKAVVKGVPVERLDLWIDGCSTTFGIGDDGLIKTATFRGRGPQLEFGERTHLFDDYVERAGIKVPSTVVPHFDGNELPPERRLDIEIDAELPAALFLR